jgi:hypothetical protein
MQLFGINQSELSPALIFYGGKLSSIKSLPLIGTSRLDILPLGYVMERHGSGPLVLYLWPQIHSVGFLFFLGGVGGLCLISVQLEELEGELEGESLARQIRFNDSIWVHLDGRLARGVTGPGLSNNTQLVHWTPGLEHPHTDALPINRYEDTDLLWRVISQQYSDHSFLRFCDSQWYDTRFLTEHARKGRDTRKRSERRAAVFLPGRVSWDLWGSATTSTVDNRIAIFPANDLFKSFGLSKWGNFYHANGPIEILKMGDGSMRCVCSLPVFVIRTTS